MAVSRRTVLQMTGVVTVVGVTGHSTLRLSRPSLRHWLVTPDLPDRTPPGPLGETTVQVLLSTTAAVLDRPVEKGHYRDFFCWRSENLPGYKGLYEQFAASMNEAAARAGGARFIDCGTGTQRGMLAPSLRAGGVQGDLLKVRAGLFQRQALFYDRYILREIFDLFARTDAWLALGYETWPGEHRGLYTYTQPPERAQGPNDDPVGARSEENRP